MRALIVFALELLALLLLATGAAWAVWPFHPPGGLVAPRWCCGWCMAR
jgi:hypothetical protein